MVASGGCDHLQLVVLGLVLTVIVDGGSRIASTLEELDVCPPEMSVLLAVRQLPMGGSGKPSGEDATSWHAIARVSVRCFM